MQKIYEIAESENISIAYDDLQRAGDIQGFYTAHPRAGPVIVLDLYPPRTDAITVVAFCRSNQYTNDSQKEITISQDENRAVC